MIFSIQDIERQNRLAAAKMRSGPRYSSAERSCFKSNKPMQQAMAAQANPGPHLDSL
ncbi:MAG: hypothetical protein RR855_03845 [Comamonas sp.]|uniref:hypothetical protein n=1 Tax=unclassified Comamonas TaxID=2638500 RepID=UPI0013CED62C|nr:hypothetical protein [Comamonas sp. lk]